MRRWMIYLFIFCLVTSFGSASAKNSPITFYLEDSAGENQTFSLFQLASLNGESFEMKEDYKNSTENTLTPENFDSADYLSLSRRAIQVINEKNIAPDQHFVIQTTAYSTTLSEEGIYLLVNQQTQTAQIFALPASDSSGNRIDVESIYIKSDSGQTVPSVSDQMPVTGLYSSWITRISILLILIGLVCLIYIVRKKKEV